MGLFSRIKDWTDGDILYETDLENEFDNLYNNIIAGTITSVGMVQLEDSHVSTSITKAACPKNVKEAYDKADGLVSDIVYGVGWNGVTGIAPSKNAVYDKIEAMGGGAPDAHKDSHDPADGSDPLDTAAAAEISVVVAAGVGAAHSFARSDHIHAIVHAISDNHLVTIDGTTNQPISGDYGKFTTLGLEGMSKAQILSDLNVEDGADVTDATNVNAAGALMNADYNATTFMYAIDDNTPIVKTRTEVMALLSGQAGADFAMNTHKITGVVDPVAAQDVATKAYGDANWAGGSSLPVIDTTGIAKGSVDATKIVRFEVDGFTTGTTRVLTPQNKDYTIGDHADFAGKADLAHKTRHQNAGADEINVVGLSGLLADDQHVLDAEVLAVAPSKTTAAWTKSIGSGGDYADWATMIAAMPDLISHAVTVTIKAGTTLTETCNLKNKHGLTSDAAIKIQAEKYFPTSGELPTADSATATTLRDAALATAALGNDYFNGCWVFVVDGTGTDNGYVPITDYIDATGDVVVASWPGTQPDNTSRYLILGALIDAQDIRNNTLDITNSLCAITLAGIGICNAADVGITGNSTPKLYIYYCGLYQNYYSGIALRSVLYTTIRYSGIIKCNTSNSTGHGGIYMEGCPLFTALSNGLSDNYQRGVYVKQGSFCWLNANFGDANGVWGAYAITSGQIYASGTECSGSSGNHSDPGTAGTANADQAAAY